MPLASNESSRSPFGAATSFRLRRPGSEVSGVILDGAKLHSRLNNLIILKVEWIKDSESAHTDGLISIVPKGDFVVGLAALDAAGHCNLMLG